MDEQDVLPVREDRNAVRASAFRLTLKLASYRAVMRQFALPCAGFKLCCRQDTNLFAPGRHAARADPFQLSCISDRLRTRCSRRSFVHDRHRAVEGKQSKVRRRNLDLRGGQRSRTVVANADIRRFLFMLRLGPAATLVPRDTVSYGFLIGCALMSCRPCLGEPWGGIYAR